jgi:hypothetical protein
MQAAAAASKHHAQHAIGHRNGVPPAPPPTAVGPAAAPGALPVAVLPAQVCLTLPRTGIIGYINTHKGLLCLWLCHLCSFVRHLSNFCALALKNCTSSQRGNTEVKRKWFSNVFRVRAL